MPVSEPAHNTLGSRWTKFRRRHKPRLYIGYYIRPSCPMHPHQALLAGPEYIDQRSSQNSYLKFHLTQDDEDSTDDSQWTYEHASIESIHFDSQLLALVCLGKIVMPLDGLHPLLKQVRIYRSCNPKQTKDNTWVASAFNMLGNNGHLTHAATLASTHELEARSQAFIQAHGRWYSNARGDAKIPVLDLMYYKDKMDEIDELE